MTPPDALPTRIYRTGVSWPAACPAKGGRGVVIRPLAQYICWRRGRYLGVLPGSLLRYGVLRDVVKVLPVEFPAKPGPVGIITLKNRTLSPTVKLFIEIAHELAEPLLKFNGAAPPKRRS